MMTEIDPARVDAEQGDVEEGQHDKDVTPTSNKDGKKKKRNKGQAKEKVKGIIDIPYLLSPQGILKIVELVSFMYAKYQNFCITFVSFFLNLIIFFCILHIESFGWA